MTLSQERVARAKKGGTDDYALLLQAQVTVFGTLDLPELIKDLDAIIDPSDLKQFVEGHAVHPAAEIVLAIRRVVDGEERQADGQIEQ